MLHEIEIVTVNYIISDLFKMSECAFVTRTLCKAHHKKRVPPYQSSVLIFNTSVTQLLH